MISVGTPRQRMVPVSFDHCVGWLHPAAGRHGVLLCGALNHEILPLYQSWQTLAAMVAAAGLPTLRFDYHGTGDSLGGDSDPHRLEAWLNSIRAAARFMREEAGVETLDLVGIRLGATLAVLTADEVGVERLALIAPVVSGRLYIREAQARSAMLAGMWRLGEAAALAGKIVNDGFVTLPETAAQISRIDLARNAPSSAGKALIMSEKPAASLDKLAHAMEARGCQVARKSFEGFAAAMDSATLAKIPFADWREIAAFLTEDRKFGEYSLAPPRPGALATSSFREERMLFGHNNRLAGVLCRPARERATATVLFLNTGGNPHLGWGRMSVETARALAAHGIASLRVDIAGLGDATLLEGSPRVALYREESIADLREALDLMEAQGLSDFTLVGHCSGAWLALHGALSDVRVRRLFLVNLQRFIWTGEENLETLMAQAYRATDSYLQEIGSGVIWRRMLKGGVNWARMPGIARSIVNRAAARLGNKVWPVIARLAGIETQTDRIKKLLTQLSERGTDILLVYSDTDPGREELARHFAPSGCRLRMPGLGTAIIANADHDITSEEARHDYFNLLVGHLGCEVAAISAPSACEQRTLVAEAA
jgi:pimeloyl-ACP methyl ester carboxylesterase